MKTSTQLKALIRNLSKEKNVQLEVILRTFMHERLLERVAKSKYRNRFILKGGLLIAAIAGIDARSTMDMDVTVKDIMLSEGVLEDVINEILATNVADGVSMTLRKLESIRDEAEYPGYRVSINAVFDKTRQTMKVDITTGDRITREAIKYSYPLMLEERSISVLAYNLETVLAEKLETILSRGTTTTRMRDFYDVYLLTAMHEEEVNEVILNEAFKNTSEHRGSYGNIQMNGLEYIKTIEESEVLLRLWEQYCSKNKYVSAIEWLDAVEQVKRLMERIKLI